MVMDGKNGYSLEEAERDIAGTDIILYLKKEEKEFLEEARISYLVRKYSDHLAYSYPYSHKQPAAFQQMDKLAGFCLEKDL